MLLLLVGVVPIGIAGILVIRRAERTALEEVVRGNRRLAARAASSLSQRMEAEEQRLQALAVAFNPALGATPEQRARVLKGFRIAFRHVRSIDVVGGDCLELAT